MFWTFNVRMCQPCCENYTIPGWQLEKEFKLPARYFEGLRCFETSSWNPATMEAFPVRAHPVATSALVPRPNGMGPSNTDTGCSDHQARSPSCARIQGAFYTRTACFWFPWMPITQCGPALQGPGGGCRVCTCLLWQVMLYWRDDLDGVMQQRCGVPSLRALQEQRIAEARAARAAAEERRRREVEERARRHVLFLTSFFLKSNLAYHCFFLLSNPDMPHGLPETDSHQSPLRGVERLRMQV